jgi:hypothetical protein
MKYFVSIGKGYGYTALEFVFDDRSEAFDFAELAVMHGKDVKVKVEFDREADDE